MLTGHCTDEGKSVDLLVTLSSPETSPEFSSPRSEGSSLSHTANEQYHLRRMQTMGFFGGNHLSSVLITLLWFECSP